MTWPWWVSSVCAMSQHTGRRSSCLQIGAKSTPEVGVELSANQFSLNINESSSVIVRSPLSEWPQLAPEALLLPLAEKRASPCLSPHYVLQKDHWEHPEQHLFWKLYYLRPLQRLLRTAENMIRPVCHPSHTFTILAAWAWLTGLWLTPSPLHTHTDNSPSLPHPSNKQSHSSQFWSDVLNL